MVCGGLVRPVRTRAFVCLCVSSSTASLLCALQMRRCRVRGCRAANHPPGQSVGSPNLGVSADGCVRAAGCSAAGPAAISSTHCARGGGAHCGTTHLACFDFRASCHTFGLSVSTTAKARNGEAITTLQPATFTPFSTFTTPHRPKSTSKPTHHVAGHCEPCNNRGSAAPSSSHTRWRFAARRAAPPTQQAPCGGTAARCSSWPARCCWSRRSQHHSRRQQTIKTTSTSQGRWWCCLQTRLGPSTTPGACSSKGTWGRVSGLAVVVQQRG